MRGKVAEWAVFLTMIAVIMLAAVFAVAPEVRTPEGPGQGPQQEVCSQKQKECR